MRHGSVNIKMAGETPNIYIYIYIYVYIYVYIYIYVVLLSESWLLSLKLVLALLSRLFVICCFQNNTFSIEVLIHHHLNFVKLSPLHLSAAPWGHILPGCNCWHQHWDPKKWTYCTCMWKLVVGFFGVKKTEFHGWSWFSPLNLPFCCVSVLFNKASWPSPNLPQCSSWLLPTPVLVLLQWVCHGSKYRRPPSLKVCAWIPKTLQLDSEKLKKSPTT